MIPKRHSPEQIIRKLRTADQLLNQGLSVADLWRALEVSSATEMVWLSWTAHIVNL
jgi:putative transposase